MLFHSKWLLSGWWRLWCGAPPLVSVILWLDLGVWTLDFGPWTLDHPPTHQPKLTFISSTTLAGGCHLTTGSVVWEDLLTEWSLQPIPVTWVQPTPLKSGSPLQSWINETFPHFIWSVGQTRLGTAVGRNLCWHKKESNQFGVSSPIVSNWYKKLTQIKSNQVGVSPPIGSTCQMN